MTTQAELDFQAAQGPSVEPRDIVEMERLLANAGDWMRAKDFPAMWNERSLRAAASESEGRIISGQRGYKLTRLATPDEKHRSVSWLRHQAQTMNKRAIEIDLVWEALPPPEEAEG